MFGKEDHPIILFTYYVNIMLLIMMTNHPVVLTASAMGAVLWQACLFEKREYVISILFYLLLIGVITGTNPLFCHKGETIYFFLNGNPVTREALRYGIFMGIKMTAVLSYSRCFSEVFTSSRFLYLFGKLSPKAALLLSMALSFLPRFRRQQGEVARNQKTMGMYEKGSLLDLIASKARVFDFMVTWSLEMGVVTADSMNARAYGSGKRTNYAVYVFRKRDGRRLAFLICLFAGCYLAFYKGAFGYGFYPVEERILKSALSISGYVVAAVAALLPVCVEIKERIKWSVLKSRI